MNKLKTQNGELQFPVYLPDATRGIVKAVDAKDLEDSGIKGLVVNTLHLASKPGMTTMQYHGGIHQFMGWKAPIISDSGGYQVFSLVFESKLGSISRKGFTYKLDKKDKKRNLTPEKCIQLQFQIGADVMYCLDYCTHPKMDQQTQQTSVEYTIDWAKKCRAEYDLQLTQKNIKGPRPLLFGVVQGGNDPELRRQCAEALLEIGFDGFGYGGWPINEEGGLVDAVAQVRSLIPESYPTHALGIGKPENVVSAFNSGYNIFDCVLPTRDARHKRIYAFNEDFVPNDLKQKDFYHYLYMQDDKYLKDDRPLDMNCDCLCCQRYSRSYLYHLFRINDGLANRLATMHNLRFYTRLMEQFAISN